jgi:flagellar biosynthesis protein FliP
MESTIRDINVTNFRLRILYFIELCAVFAGFKIHVSSFLHIDIIFMFTSELITTTNQPVNQIASYSCLFACILVQSGTCI